MIVLSGYILKSSSGFITVAKQSKVNKTLIILWVNELRSMSSVKDFLNRRVTCQWILVVIIFKEVCNIT